MPLKSDLAGGHADLGSGGRLRRLGRHCAVLVRERKIAGCVILVSQHGRALLHEAHGQRRLEGHVPLQRDSIFRIASLTKPITAAAMMLLWDGGHWALDDPVSRHLPEFHDLKGPGGEPVRPPLMAELMNNMVGFGDGSHYATLRIHEGGCPDPVAAIAELPLVSYPGTDWQYGPCATLQGCLVERLSGQPLDQFLRERLFGPLAMFDTDFVVESSQADRLSDLHHFDSGGTVIAVPQPNDPLLRPPLLDGGGGLYSTAFDCWRFAQMLLNGGHLGRRILSRRAVRLMTSDSLHGSLAIKLSGRRQPHLGFGFNMAVVREAADDEFPLPVGASFWAGVYGSWLWIDPRNGLSCIGLVHHLDGGVRHGQSPFLRGHAARLIYGQSRTCR